MKYAIYTLLSLMIWMVASCSKQSGGSSSSSPYVQPSVYPTTPTYDTTTSRILLTQWTEIPGNTGNVYRSILTPANASTFSMVFVEIYGISEQLTVSPIAYLGGELTYADHSGEQAVYYHTNSGSLPFDTLTVKVVDIIAITH